jgi:hypothetical protein
VGDQSEILAPVLPIDLPKTVIAGLLIEAILFEIAFGHDDRDDFKGVQSILPGSMGDQTGIPQHFSFGKLIFGNETDYIRQMQNFFHAGVGGSCYGKKLLHSGWKAGLQALLAQRCNIFQYEKKGDGHKADDFNGFLDGVEYHPFLEFGVELTHRVTRNHMDVEKLHFPSSSLKIPILLSHGSRL